MDKFKRTLLIVDDTEINLDLLTDIFKDSYNILTAASGKKALEILRERTNGIDAVLLDIVMPDINGYQVLETMMKDERLKFLPVIVITSHDDIDSECKAFELGAVDFITRPFNTKMVEKRVKSVLRQQELKAKEADETRIENMINNALCGVCLCEQDETGSLKPLHCSKGLSNMMGCSDYDEFVNDIVERPSERVVNASDIDEFKKKFEAAASSGHSVEHTFLCNSYSNRLIWIQFQGQVSLNEKGVYSVYAFINDVTKEKEYEHELKAGAYYDSLTGIYNRKSFFANAKRLIDGNPDAKYEVMRLNIGSFKLINDMMGRDVGDKALICVADTLREVAPENSVFGRFFADNFVIIAEKGKIDPESLIESVKTDIKSAEIISHEVQYYLGIYTVSDNKTRIDDMCDRALIACRSITGSFNNHIAYYDDRMRLEMLEEQEMIDQAHRAIENGEFCVYYQSVYGIKARRFVSAEALVRWKHPTNGLIPPGKFIPVFERNGFITKLDLYILEQVCKYQKKRSDLGLPEFPISVNISRMSLYNPKLFDIISELTEKYGVSPKTFRIEVTESAYNDNPTQLLETIDKLREKCYPVLMDDFGSGYSSLNTLKDIPIDILKLDMKFMQGFETNSRVGTIVTSVARMSKWLNVPMLAEGVETKEQYEFLKSIGCAYIQGYYFSKPVCEDEFTELIAKENVTPLTIAIESYGINEDISEILGSNTMVSKLISGAFGGFGIYELSDDRLEVIRVNEGYMQIMGYAPSDYKGENANVWEKMVPEDIPKSRQACIDALHSDKPTRTVVRRYGQNGKLLYLDGIHRRLGGTDENPVFCIAFNDITEQIESERIIRNSSERISNILDATGTIVVDIDFVGDTTFCAGDTDEYGFDTHQLARMLKSRRGLSEFTHPDELEKMRKFHMSKSTDRISADFRLKNIQGDYTWCRFTKTQSFDENGVITRMMGIIGNIEAEKRVGEELEITHKRADTTFNSIKTGILVADVAKDFSLDIVYSNNSFWNLIGIERSECTNLPLYVSKKLPEDKIREIKQKISLGEAVDFQYCLVGEDGTEKWIECSFSPTESFDSDKPHRYLAILDDVTKRHLAIYQMNQLINNLDCGLGLIDDIDGEISLPYSNNNFFDVLHLSKSNGEKINDCLKTIIESDADDMDMNIEDGSGKKHIAKIHRAIVYFGSGSRKKSYIVTAKDVTGQRAETRNRIAERKANALRGLYDAVFKIDYGVKTSLMVSNRSNPQKAKNSRPMSLDYIIGEWTDANIHPEDREKARALFCAPINNPDFTDSYAEIRMAVPLTYGQYKTFGMVIVRSAADVCMLFIRDMLRIDNSATSDEVAEVNRLYQLVAEQTNTTVIEYDHVTEKVTVSPSLYMYAAAMLTENELVKKENYMEGLAIHPDDRKIFTEFANKIGVSDKIETVTLRMEMTDKSFKWCRLCVSVSKSNTGEILKSLCTINLVHEEVEARRRAESIDMLMRKTVKHIPMGVGIFKLYENNLVPLYLSDNAYKIFGINENYKTVDPKITQDFMANNKLEPGKEHEYTQHCIRPDGSCFWLNTKYYVREEKGNTFIYSAIEDVSEQVEAKRSQAVHEQMYQLLLEETGTIIFHYDNETDEFFYYQPASLNVKKTECINNYSKCYDKFSILAKDDRVKFAEVIERLSEKPSSSELVVTVTMDMDAYPRRYRCFFKSMEDMEGQVFRIIGKIEDVDDEVNRLEKIKAKAMYDSLCVDLYNKATTEELIRAELEHSAGGALLMIDVDDFKSINDTLGHIFGDEFLKTFATTIKTTFRDSDIVGRYGGDEFFVFINRASAALAVKKAEQILEKVTRIDIPKLGCVKSSIGVATVNPENRDYLQIIKQADSALYTAKNRGKNQVVLFDPAAMSENSYRTENTGREKHNAAPLSSNPLDSASIIMRIFSALYSSRDLSVAINQMLDLVGKTYDVSRAYIFEDSEDGKYCSNTFEWCNDGVESKMSLLQRISYEEDLNGNYRDNMNDDGIFYCHDISELSEAHYKILAKQHVKSVLQCAIMDKGEFKGFVGFDEYRANRLWTQDQIDALAFVSKVLSVFLLKDRSRQQKIKP